MNETRSLGHKRFHPGVLLWPLPFFSTLLFFVLMMAYPLILGIRNYGILNAPGTVGVSNSHLQLDLSWMHVFSDVLAGVYGAWLSCAIYRSQSMIAPLWKGIRASRYVVPMAKAGLLCAFSYLLACLPAIVRTMSASPGPFPLLPLIGGMMVLSVCCCFGYAIGVMTGSKWSVVGVGIALALLCLGGFFAVHPRVPEGSTSPRVWGNGLSAVLPVSDSGIGAEPGLRMSVPGFIVRAAFFLAVAVVCLLACLYMAQSTITRHRAAAIKAICAIVVIPVALGFSIALSGIGIWLRTGPFTPVCENIEQSGVTVCSHPDDQAHRSRYAGYVRSALRWMPTDQISGGQVPAKKLYLLLGNAFTPETNQEQWNVDDEGKRMIPENGPNTEAIEIMTDTATQKNRDYSDLSMVMQVIVSQYLPAHCAQVASRTVFEQKTLRNGADVSAFILGQLPIAMRDNAYGNTDTGLSSMYDIEGASDRTIKELGSATDSQLQGFIKRNAAAIETCALTPKQVQADSIGRSGK
ncbi:hypothetical protein [Bifidobacterium sp. ESL0704]|uniref:hypothetical protein n=1 Tax=Bifidobacterium sp. ESL0704 TaxID=2983219 RepID=UPI0023F80638|nr:hypothetical protein [Bifidobacterium sp. ESL0704]WEV52274.1 hypothetical protein OZX64_05020 [Bifidobacterium sp. ESL0704]